MIPADGPPPATVPRARPLVMHIHAAILCHTERAGYATSVHRMGHYCELDAVRKPDAGELHIARAEGDSHEQVYLAACELARMVGLDLEG